MYMNIIHHVYQLHGLSQNHSGNNREGTLFSQCSRRQARKVIKVIIGDPRHTECSNLTETRWV